MFTKLFLKSEGLKRTIASVLVVAGQIASAVPALTPYAEAINMVAAFFAGTGLFHAAVGK